jgi:hypothetical protein
VSREPHCESTIFRAGAINSTGAVDEGGYGCRWLNEVIGPIQYASRATKGARGMAR